MITVVKCSPRKNSPWFGKVIEWYALQEGTLRSATKYMKEEDAINVANQLNATQKPFYPEPEVRSEDYFSMSKMRKARLAGATTFIPNPGNCTGIRSGRQRKRNAKRDAMAITKILSQASSAV